MSKACAICYNSKTINCTNRLVVEICGHVKCMDCLTQEKNGCRVCLEVSENVQPEFVVDEKKANSSNCNAIKNSEKVIKKEKPETSHIVVEIDANGKHFLCTLCKKKFKARVQKAYHAYCNGQRKPFECIECDKSFATQSHLKYHMLTHSNERPYACDICGCRFLVMCKLQRHKLVHTNEKKHVCDKCNKCFNSMEGLHKHSSIHTEEKPYACPKCDRRFRESSNLRKHIILHDESRRAAAAVGKSSASKASPARRHTCPQCARIFSVGKDLRRHMAMHTGSKPYRCKVCNRKIKRKDNLERHIRITHPDYPVAAAVDCDNTEPEETPRENVETPPPQDQATKLQILNTLPVLTQEVIQTHIACVEFEGKQIAPDDLQKKDKSYILEANHARESVIFGPIKKEMNVVTKANAPEFEYVHKIRKAHFSLSHKDSVPLPPVDERKMMEIHQKTSFNTLDEKVPPTNVELYKKILYERPEKESYVTTDGDIGNTQNASHEMHWRRKMKLNNTLIL